MNFGWQAMEILVLSCLEFESFTFYLKRLRNITWSHVTIDLLEKARPEYLLEFKSKFHSCRQIFAEAATIFLTQKPRSARIEHSICTVILQL